MGKCCGVVVPAILVLGGIAFIGLGAGLGWGLFPSVIRDTVKKNIDLMDKDSEGFQNFEKPPVDLHMSFTFLNVDNPEQVVTNAEKPKFTEQGPYAYKEVKEKQEISFTHDYMDYAQYRRFEFDPAASCPECKKDDMVRILNMPLIAAVAAAKEKGGFQEDFAIGQIAKAIDNTPNSKDLFLEETVDKILFAGVKSTLVNAIMTDGALKNLLPPAIQDNGFAIMNTKNDTTFNECYRVGVSNEDDHTEILMWGADLDNLVQNLTTTRTCYTKLADGSNHPTPCRAIKPWWPYRDLTGLDYHDYKTHTSSCNVIRGTNGEQFPPFLEERKEEPLYVFATDLCRTINLAFKEDHDIDGIHTLRYHLPRETGFINKTDNFCFCEELANKWNDTCIKNITGSDELDITECKITKCHDGLQDLKRCQLAPLVMSSPHFFGAEQQLEHFGADSGLNPQEELHQTILDIEPLTGFTLSAHKRLQMNMPIVATNRPEIVFLESINEFPAFPILWLDEGADIDQENIDKVKKKVTTPLLLVDVARYTLIALGVAGVGLAILLFCCCK